MCEVILADQHPTGLRTPPRGLASNAVYLTNASLEALTGERKMDAGAMLEYFEPLKKWLDEQNKGRKVGY